MSICTDCDGKGFKEYDAGLVQIGCKTCEMTGKVDCKLTKEEFEKAYAFRSDMTPDQVAGLGLVAVPFDCLEGWAMQNVSNIVEETEETSVTTSGTINDSVDESSVPHEKPRELKPDEYFCTKCGSVHRVTSKIGKKHLEFKKEE